MRSAAAASAETTSFGKSGQIRDDVIGGKRNDQRVVFALGGKHRAGGNGWTGIAPHRLKHDIGLRSDRGELIGDQETILIVGHDERAPK
jgi:hypothetical protein